MFSIELLIVSTLKALAEIAGMALLSQGLVGLLAGKARQGRTTSSTGCSGSSPRPS